MVGASPIVANETTFSIKSNYGFSAVMLYVLNFTEATGIPTTKDISGQIPVGGSGNGDLGAGTSFSETIPGPSDANSYQIAGYATGWDTADFPGFGSDDSWVQLRKIQDSSSATLCVGYRKGDGSSADDTGLALGAGAFTYNVFGWGEVAATQGGATSASGGGSGGGGDGGTITSLSQLVSVLDAGVRANGGKTYTLDAIDFGSMSLLNYNFAANPITFVGQVGTTFGSIALNNCHGLTFKDAMVQTAGATALQVLNGSTDIVFDGVYCDNGAVEGSPVSDTSAIVAHNCGPGVKFVGRRDAMKPDLTGYWNAASVVNATGLTFKDLTVTNNGTDGFLIFASQNVTIDGCLGYNFYGFGEGDHPDWIQWATAGLGDRGSGHVIKNNGYIRGVGQYSQGYFGEDTDNVLVQGNWCYDGVYNTYACSGSNHTTFSDNFGQGDSTYHAQVIWRGACDHTTVTNNVLSGGPNDYGGDNTNSTVSGNTAIPDLTAGDFTQLDAWLATHAAARPRPASF